jgi:Cu/Ag efflux protein CusF
MNGVWQELLVRPGTARANHGDASRSVLAEDQLTTLESAPMIRRNLFVCLLALVAAGCLTPALAQKPVSDAVVTTETAVIIAIDSTNRMITLKGEDGMIDSIYAGPDVQRFNELKVGDKVTFRYYESVVYAIQQPGATPPAPAATAITRGTGPKPGGTMSEQMTTVVTIQAIDLKVSSVTIKTEDGSTMSFKVEDKKNLSGVKVGDKVQITYTRALAISVEAPKK